MSLIEIDERLDILYKVIYMDFEMGQVRIYQDSLTRRWYLYEIVDIDKEAVRVKFLFRDNINIRFRFSHPFIRYSTIYCGSIALYKVIYEV